MLCMLDHAVIPHSHTHSPPFEKSVVDLGNQNLQFLKLIFYHKMAGMSSCLEQYFRKSDTKAFLLPLYDQGRLLSDIEFGTALV